MTDASNRIQAGCSMWFMGFYRQFLAACLANFIDAQTSSRELIAIIFSICMSRKLYGIPPTPRPDSRTPAKGIQSTRNARGFRRQQEFRRVTGTGYLTQGVPAVPELPPGTPSRNSLPELLQNGGFFELSILSPKLPVLC